MKTPNRLQETFIQERAVSGKSLRTLAGELKVGIEELMEWEEEFEEQIIARKLQEYDRIQAEHKMNYTEQYAYYAQLYTRLKGELDKRDFSGLPTDKLYYILNDTLKQARFIKSMDLLELDDEGELDDEWADENLDI